MERCQRGLFVVVPRAAEIIKRPGFPRQLPWLKNNLVLRALCLLGRERVLLNSPIEAQRSRLQFELGPLEKAVR
jgi:hypothetical protein